MIISIASCGSGLEGQTLGGGPLDTPATSFERQQAEQGFRTRGDLRLQTFRDKWKLGIESDGLSLMALRVARSLPPSAILRSLARIEPQGQLIQHVSQAAFAVACDRT